MSFTAPYLRLSALLTTMLMYLAEPNELNAPKFCIRNEVLAFAADWDLLRFP
jgi:hypothetical protein